MIYEVKLKEMMGVVFQELVRMSAIENKLIGTVKLANEEQQDDYNSVDKCKVKLMNNAGGADSTVDAQAVRAAAAGTVGAGARAKLPPPVAASREAVQQFENMQKRPLRSSQEANGTALRRRLLPRSEAGSDSPIHAGAGPSTTDLTAGWALPCDDRTITSLCSVHNCTAGPSRPFPCSRRFQAKWQRRLLATARRFPRRCCSWRACFRWQFSRAAEP